VEVRGKKKEGQREGFSPLLEENLDFASLASEFKAVGQEGQS
jgi:hypothetical protein